MRITQAQFDAASNAAFDAAEASPDEVVLSDRALLAFAAPARAQAPPPIVGRAVVEDGERPGDGGDEARECLEQRGLTRAVGANEDEQVARPKRKRHVAHHGLVSVTNGECVGVNMSRHRTCTDPCMCGNS